MTGVRNSRRLAILRSSVALQALSSSASAGNGQIFSNVKLTGDRPIALSKAELDRAAGGIIIVSGIDAGSLARFQTKPESLGTLISGPGLQPWISRTREVFQP
jgi:hypothetical protein